MENEKFEELVQIILNKVGDHNVIEPQEHHKLEFMTNRSRSPFIVGISGGVGVGKSCLCERLHFHLQQQGYSVTIVNGDSFIMSNAVLHEKGLTRKKGFPETFYQKDAIQFLIEIRSWKQKSKNSIFIPIYDHLIYDVKENEKREISYCDILLFEGVNVLRFGEYLDLKIYLDANENDIKNWYYCRRNHLKDSIPQNPLIMFPNLLYFPIIKWISLTVFEMLLNRVLDDNWRNINIPNLHDHILPLKENADLIIRKAADHSVENIFTRSITSFKTTSRK